MHNDYRFLFSGEHNFSPKGKVKLKKNENQKKSRIYSENPYFTTKFRNRARGEFPDGT